MCFNGATVISCAAVIVAMCGVCESTPEQEAAQLKETVRHLVMNHLPLVEQYMSDLDQLAAVMINRTLIDTALTRIREVSNYARRNGNTDVHRRMQAIKREIKEIKGVYSTLAAKGLNQRRSTQLALETMQQFSMSNEHLVKIRIDRPSNTHYITRYSDTNNRWSEEAEVEPAGATITRKVAVVPGRGLCTWIPEEQHRLGIVEAATGRRTPLPNIEASSMEEPLAMVATRQHLYICGVKPQNDTYRGTVYRICLTEGCSWVLMSSVMERFDFPEAAATATDTHLYVVDYSGRQIQIYDIEADRWTRFHTSQAARVDFMTLTVQQDVLYAVVDSHISSFDRANSTWVPRLSVTPPVLMSMFRGEIYVNIALGVTITPDPHFATYHPHNNTLQRNDVIAPLPIDYMMGFFFVI